MPKTDDAAGAPAYLPAQQPNDFEPAADTPLPPPLGFSAAQPGR
jgi:hypothetical protein